MWWTDIRIRRASAVALLSLAACSGGDVIPPFWMFSGLVVADLDGDGQADVAVAATNVAGPPPHPGYVWVYRQSLPGMFEPPFQYGIGPDPWGLSTGDIDGDGRPDLVAATPSTVAPEPGVITSSGGISLLRQDFFNAGSFLPSQWIRTGGAAQDAAIAELTSGAPADVIVADGVLVNGRALLLEQDPGLPGTFLAPVSLPVGTGRGSEDVAVAFVNGDLLSDIVLAVGDAVAVFYQKAGGGFDLVEIIPAGVNVQGVAVARLDGDARADIVAANAGNAPAGGTGGSSVTVLRQTSPGVFVATDIPIAADGARRVAIGDLNDDGVPDIAVVSLVYQAQVPSRVTVLLQSPMIAGQFTVGGVYDGPFTGNFIGIGDVNGDGLEDIVVNDGPSVLLQRASPAGSFEPLRPLR